MPFSPIHLLLFIVFIAALLAFVHIGILAVAFEKLGLSEDSAILLFFVSLIGSAINLPLFSVRAEAPTMPAPPPEWRGVLRAPQRQPFTGRTIIAVNVGGALVPMMFSAYLLGHSTLDPLQIVLATGIVTWVAYAFSRPVPGVGIGMPIFIAPITAALCGVLLGGDNSAALAYIGGTMGVLIGADILRLRAIQTMGAPIASIGGAGTFDGIFMTGIVAVLLA